MGYNKQWENYTEKYQKLCMENDVIPDSLFKEYGVNRGLRDINGNGVLTGLTNISRIDSFCVKDGKKVPCDGKLWYRGYNVTDWIGNIPKDSLGFGKTAYLLLFGKAPTAEEEKEFKELMGKCRALPTNFTRDVIMKAPSKDIMNSMTRSILTLASYDENVNSNDIGNVIRQCVNLISVFPMLAVYAYHAYNHYERDESMYIHRPNPGLSTAENLLMLLRPDKQYSFLEAKVLDVALMLHMEHGGGNNSTFTTRVVTSSGSDTYSAVAAAMSSLKGPRHGGANIKVMEMMDDIREHVKDYEDKDEIKETLEMVYSRFPRLEERKNQPAGTLSGGEQQMLAMGRALMSKPRIILMDEPSMGLSPIFVNEIFDIIQKVSAGGTTVLLVEQNAKKALSIADRGYVLETGKIVLEGKASELLNDESVKKAYLGE